MKEQDLLKNGIIAEDMEAIYCTGTDWRSFDEKTVLITGGYGMLTSYMVLFLLYLRLKQNIDVTVVVQGRNRKKAEKRFGRYMNDAGLLFTDEDLLSFRGEGIPSADYIIHGAGLANPSLYTTNPVEVIEPNVVGCYRLLQYAVRAKTKSFLYFSSGDVYGLVENAETITEEMAGSMDPLDPHSCYGESKRMGETICAAFWREYGVRTVLARIGHTYGPTMDIENDPRVFSSFMKNILRGEDIVLHSDGSARRPFCYISDAIAAYFLLLLEGKGGEAYNVTNTDEMYSIRELADMIALIPDPGVKAVYQKRAGNETYLNNNLNLGNRPSEDKLKALGWNHTVSAREGFERVYRFYKE